MTDGPVASRGTDLEGRLREFLALEAPAMAPPSLRRGISAVRPPAHGRIATLLGRGDGRSAWSPVSRMALIVIVSASVLMVGAALALVAVEHGTGRAHLDGHRDHGQQRREEHQGQEGQDRLRHHLHARIERRSGTLHAERGLAQPRPLVRGRAGRSHGARIRVRRAPEQQAVPDDALRRDRRRGPQDALHHRGFGAHLGAGADQRRHLHVVAADLPHQIAQDAEAGDHPRWRGRRRAACWSRSA